MRKSGVGDDDGENVWSFVFIFRPRMTPTRVFYNFLRIIYVTYVFSYLWEIYTHTHIYTYKD